jgi:hypothetical protein
MWCSRRVEKVSRIGRMKNEEGLQRLEERNFLLTVKRNKANWIGHILRGNCLLKYVIEGKKDRSDGKKRKKT